MNRTLPIALSAVFVLTGCQHVAPAPAPAVAPPLAGLHSPWDTTPVTLTDSPYDCGNFPQIGPDITVSGTLGNSRTHVSEDVKAAVYGESTAGLEDYAARVIHAADFYRSTGSRAAAQCVITMLSTASANQAMTGYKASTDAWMEQNLALRAFSIAWLKVRGSNLASPIAITSLTNWMEDIVRSERSHWEHDTCNERTCYIKGHRGMQTAMAAAAIAIAANDPGLFHWSTSQYHSAVGEINGRGMLHYDTRGHDAFKFNLESAASLVQIAEFAEINGEPLYGYDDGAIHLLVHTVALGIVSPEAYHSATKASQAIPSGVQPWEITWASVYNRRFPDPVVTSLLQQVGPGGVDMWGGEPWDPEGAPEPGQ
jgi:poly(beta-D-mannuronate) lyase